MRFQIALLSLMVLATGCKKPASVSTQPVTGRITIGGKPLVGATVVFTNKNPDAPSAGGTTDNEGEFKLSTRVGPKELYAGAVSGEYDVTISKAPPGAERATDSSKMEHASPEERQQWMADQMKQAHQASSDPKPKSEVPEKYSTPTTTPLHPAVVVGDNRFDWPLDEK